LEASIAESANWKISLAGSSNSTLELLVFWTDPIAIEPRLRTANEILVFDFDGGTLEVGRAFVKSFKAVD